MEWSGVEWKEGGGQALAVMFILLGGGRGVIFYMAWLDWKLFPPHISYSAPFF